MNKLVIIFHTLAFIAALLEKDFILATWVGIATAYAVLMMKYEKMVWTHYQS